MKKPDTSALEAGKHDRTGSIESDERTGVLQPRNLPRYNAAWIAPAPRVSAVVDTYWTVDWRLGGEEAIEQHVVDFPAVTLSVEVGAVPGHLVATGVQDSTWVRTIRDWGSVFAIRLRPAGLSVVSDIRPQELRNRTVVLSPNVDERLHAIMREIASAGTHGEMAVVANEVIGHQLQMRPITADGRLANAVVGELRTRIRSRAGGDLAQRFDTSERSVQRALRATVGKGPKWVSRRIRLQEVARILASEPATDLASVAAELGYSDQAHLTNDFREITGFTPAAYRQSLTRLAGAAGHRT